MKKILLFLSPVFLAGFLVHDRNADGALAQYRTNKPDAVIHDGPYLMFRNKKAYVKYIHVDGTTKTPYIDSMASFDRGKLVLHVSTDEPGKTFQVQIKDRIQPERSETKKPEKELVISDIEGNFGAFKKLLLAAGVINEQYDWTFGKGHLLLIGDFVDRGFQQTEVLWLIYALEDKAKKAGGYVHYVLGNHEIMNMNGDLRYLHPKYTESAILLKENYVDLLGRDSELGQWLRSKNVVEKIGGVLYTHGGISRQVNLLDITLTDINKVSRPFYDDSTLTFPDTRLDTLFSDFGPFWYRGYYTGDRSQVPGILDTTLRKFGVGRVVTGHTMVADTISIWYNNKLINTDTHHVKGKSEALLIEGKTCYRLKPDGKKIMLTTD
jgi:hypothetical protein